MWLTVSPKYGIAVFIIDAIKGLCAILFARWVGVTGLWLMLPAATVILGHWNSPFTGFRGGDGVASMSGLAFGLLGISIVISFPAFLLISLGFHSSFKNPTLWGALAAIIAMFISTLTLNIFYSDLVLLSLPDPWSFLFTVPDFSIYLGMVIITLAILFHSYRYHKSNQVANGSHSAMRETTGKE